MKGSAKGKGKGKGKGAEPNASKKAQAAAPIKLAVLSDEERAKHTVAQQHAAGVC
eukprot:g20143.t1